MKRHLALLAALLAMVTTVGCSASAGKSASNGVETAASKKSAASAKKVDAGLAALAVETVGEKAALEAAKADEGRTWASGNAATGKPVAGEPFLAGYVCLVHDKAKQYQVKVLDGKVVPYFGAAGDAILIGKFENLNPTIEPESDTQKAAFAAAKAEVAKTNPAATQGGIELYAIYFPKTGAGAYPSVMVYADRSVGSTYASGGTEVR